MIWRMGVDEMKGFQFAIRPTDLLPPGSTILAGGKTGDDGFAVKVPVNGVSLRVICSWEGGWDHVSVSLPNRCPTWGEMCAIKSIFFRPDECVVEYHPPEEDYIRCHPFCLHLWKPQNEEIPRPPYTYVGGKSDAETKALASEMGLLNARSRR